MSDAIIARLPSQYHVIRIIPSHLLRTKLAQDLEMIGIKLEELKQLEISENTTRFIKQFFTYLNNSCASPATLIPRAPWLSSFAKVTLDKIYQVQNKAQALAKVPSDKDADHFEIITAKLVQLVYRYTLRHATVSLPHFYIYQYLTSIVNETQELIPDLNDVRYLKIVNRFTNLIERLAQVLHVPHVLYVDHEFLSGQLKEIDYLTKRYVLGWSF